MGPPRLLTAQTAITAQLAEIHRSGPTCLRQVLITATAGQRHLELLGARPATALTRFCLAAASVGPGTMVQQAMVTRKVHLLAQAAAAVV